MLALRYLRRSIPYARIVFTSFIAYSFGHTLGFAAFTGARSVSGCMSTAGVTAIDVATVTAFCSLSMGIGLATISGLSLLLSPEQAAHVLHLDRNWSLLVGGAAAGRGGRLRAVGRASRAARSRFAAGRCVRPARYRTATNRARRCST